MAIKLEMLRCFSAVAGQGSLAEASKTLGRTPSAVSMMLKQFEDHIGAPLFETARKSRLTPLGALIFEEARREVAHFDNTVSVINGLGRSGTGYLRLAVTPSVATTVLPAVILRFTRKHPEVQIHIRDMDSAAIQHDLAQEKADIGIGSLSDRDGMARTKLFSDPFGIVCRRDDPLAHQTKALEFADLEGRIFIANGLCALIPDTEFAPIMTASRLMVPNTTSLLGLVRTGVGVTILPRLAITPTQTDLAFLPLSKVSTKRGVHMVSQPRNRLMPAAREFWDLVCALRDDGQLAPAP